MNTLKNAAFPLPNNNGNKQCYIFCIQIAPDSTSNFKIFFKLWWKYTTQYT